MDYVDHRLPRPPNHRSSSTFGFSQRSKSAAGGSGPAAPDKPNISDDEIRGEGIEANQLRLMKERGADINIFSPRASAMEPHVGDAQTSLDWSRACNDLIHRVTLLFPDHFIGVCQLPQTPGGTMDNSIRELERCVTELGFVGCNLNPDPSGGHWNAPPLTDKYWYPFFEKMIELEVPAMIHVSGSCNPTFHATGSYYIAADTNAFMQFIQGDLFTDFPDLRLVIPHGGGAVPYHWGRYRGLADMLDQPPVETHVMKNVYFDTLRVCITSPALISCSKLSNLKIFCLVPRWLALSGGIDPKTGQYFDDTRRYIDKLGLTKLSKNKSSREMRAGFIQNLMKN